MATMINADVHRLFPSIDITMKTRLNSRADLSKERPPTLKGAMDEYFYQKYGESKQVRYINGMIVVPVAYCRTQNPMFFQVDTNRYTPQGRERIHRMLAKSKYGETLLKLSRDNDTKHSIEFCDNRLSRFVASKGKCELSKVSLAFQIAPGYTIQEAGDNKAFVSWADADQRIQTLLSCGMYLPQVVLDNVLDNERTELATSLLYLYHDFNYEDHEFTYFDRKELSGGYPEATARWADKLADPNLLHQEIEILSHFQKDLEADQTLLRFHYHKIPKMLERLHRLTSAEQRYQANEAFILPNLSKFITDDQINSFLRSHGGRDSRLRTYSFFLRHPSEKERSDFLKETYGTGGQTPASFSEYSSSDYDSKGIKLTLSSPDSPVDTVLLKWPKVENRIDHLIRENQFLSGEDRTYFRSFERDHLVMDILTFSDALPYSNRNPGFTFDFNREKAKSALYPLVDDPDALADFIRSMEQAFSELPEDYRSYTLCQRMLTELQAYRDGTFTLFPEFQEEPPLDHNPVSFVREHHHIKAEYEELKNLLSPEEYTAARSSTLNAHYTSPTVIHAMYDALDKLGFSSGNILEPSCGIGNFFGCLPQSMQESKLYGVELDSITGRIAKQLYQKADITMVIPSTSILSAIRK